MIRLISRPFLLLVNQGNRLISIQHHWIALWTFLVLLGEWFLFKLAVMKCHWPGNASKVVVLADPQIADAYSYGQRKKSFSLWITQLTCDTYMRRSYYQLLRHHRPDLVLFLGDLFDGGREWLMNDQDQDQWNSDLVRFSRIFRLTSKKYWDGNGNELRKYYIPGNHDIGLGNQIIPQAYSRYVETFGKANWAIKMDNVSILAIDSSSLLAGGGFETTIPISQGKDLGDRPWYTNSREFVEGINQVKSQLDKRLLISHIPLYRPPNTPCGPWRASKRQPFINQGQGHQYQNLLDPESTRWILDKIEPNTLILSGDDHDWCKVEHESGMGKVSEYTVGSFSWQSGNRHPSFGMLSMETSPGNLEPIISPCFLPDQISIYIFYGISFLLSLIFIVFTHWLQFVRSGNRLQPPIIRVDAATPGLEGSLAPSISRRRSTSTAMNGLPPLAPEHDVEAGEEKDEIDFARSRSRSRSIQLSGRFTSPGGIRMDTLYEGDDPVTTFVEPSVTLLHPQVNRIVSHQEEDRVKKELIKRMLKGIGWDVGQCLIGAILTWITIVSLDWIW